MVSQFRNPAKTGMTGKTEVQMRLGETVTFGGSGLDRAAELRETAAGLWPGAGVMLLWKGRVLLDGAGRVARLGSDHPLTGDPATAIFLGEPETPVFAQDISAWEPEAAIEPGGFMDTQVQRHPGLPADWGFHELRAVMAALTPREAELAATARALMEWHRIHGFCASCGAQSVAILSGWQRSCPDCGAQHFPRTDPVVIMLITRDNRLLLGRNENWPEGMYSLLAGFIEPGETVEAAVRREVFEESGVRVGKVDYLTSQPWPFPASLMLGCRGEALTDEIVIDPKELQEALWVTREDLLSAFAGTHPKIKPSRKGAIAQFIMQHWLSDTLD
jgi:NAD+ diphosphatase